MFCRQCTDRCLALWGTMIASASCTVVCNNAHICLFFFNCRNWCCHLLHRAKQYWCCRHRSQQWLTCLSLGALQPCKASQSTMSNVLSPHNGLGHALMAYNMHSHSYCVCPQCPRRLHLSVLPVNTMGATWTIVVWYYHVYKLPGKDNWAVDDWDVSNQDNAFGQ